MSSIPSFNRLSRKTVETMEYDVPGTVGLRLIVAQATEANKSYHNDVLKSVKRSSQMVRAAGGLNSSVVEANRKMERERFKKHIVKGFAEVLDDKGKPVEYSKENADHIIGILPNHIFDAMHQELSQPETFFENEELAKNS